MTQNNLQDNLQADDKLHVADKKAWVVFCAQSDLPWLKCLKSGFRHCFLLLHDGQVWISVDPLSPYTDIQIHHHLGGGYDLPYWLKTQGYKVVQATVNSNHQRPAPWMAFTCVEAVKRILGIHRRFILTPWQLYQYLQKQNNHNIEKHKNERKISWV